MIGLLFFGIGADDMYLVDFPEAMRCLYITKANGHYVITGLIYY
jgi:hypothetical protein